MFLKITMNFVEYTISFPLFSWITRVEVICTVVTGGADFSDRHDLLIGSSINAQIAILDCWDRYAEISVTI